MRTQKRIRYFIQGPPQRPLRFMFLPPIRTIALSVAAAAAAMAAVSAAGAAQNVQKSAVRVQLDSVDKLEPQRAEGSNDAASFVTADRIEGNPQDALHLIGNAEIRRGGSVLKADRITYVQATDEVTAEGRARISRQGASFSGPSMKFRITSRSGSMSDAEYEYAPRNIRGCAKNIKFLSGDRTTLEDATVTTCKRDDEAWYIKLNELEIDEYDQTASGTGATLHFKGVPIFGTPWFSFPIGQERRSGFLTPTYGMSSTRGLDLSLPYYFNLAPNYDYTLTPRIMSKRGIMIGNEARLKLENLDAQVNFDWLPHDSETNDSRYGMHVQTHYQREKLAFDVDYNRVSDDDYISDFSGNIRESSEAVLPQDYALSWTDTYWNSTLRVTKNQTLDIDDDDVIEPYERVPQWTVNGYAADFHGFELSTTLEATRFQHHERIGGDRFVLDQSVSYPFRGAGWFIVPKAQVIGAYYELTDMKKSFTERNGFTEGYTNRTPSYFVPSLSLDAGLVFERDSSWFGRSAYQTLEPRIYYAYTPYRNQEDIPIFDTTIADLNFATLFTSNQFSGYDRVSEANQLTSVLSTRFIDKESGLELFRASIGQRQYFSDQNVGFLNLQSERDYFQTTGVTDGRRSDVRSDLLASIGARLTRSLAANATAQYSSADSRFMKVNAGVTWSPKRMSTIGLYYRYNYSATVASAEDDENIKQIDLAVQWPLTERLYALFRYNYSLYKKKPIEMIGGIEYMHDCWTLRLAAQRYTTASNKDEANFFLQLELNGLGSIGTSPISELRRNIRGYQTRETLPITPGAYDYYE